MKKGGGSGKGSSFERDVCKRFSLWISEGQRDDIFWRTAGSGARATVRGRKGQNTCSGHGDMGCLDPEYTWFTDHVLVECKRGYNSWRVDDFLKPPKGKDTLWHVWKRLEEDSLRLKKTPLLVFKQERRPERVFFPYIHGAYWSKNERITHQFSALISIATPHLNWAIRVGMNFFDTPVQQVKECLNIA